MAYLKNQIDKLGNVIEAIDTQSINTVMMIVLAIAIVLLCKVGKTQFESYEAHNIQTIKQRNEKKIQSDFDFLLREGKNKLSQHRLKEAYYEFNLAYNLNPKHEELSTIMIETLSILCVEDNHYCQELDALQTRLIKR